MFQPRVAWGVLLVGSRPDRAAAGRARGEYETLAVRHCHGEPQAHLHSAWECGEDKTVDQRGQVTAHSPGTCPCLIIYYSYYSQFKL